MTACAVPSCARWTGKGIFCARCFSLLSPGMRKTVVFLNGTDIGAPRPGMEEARANAIAQIETRLKFGVLDPATSWPFRSKEKRP